MSAIHDIIEHAKGKIGAAEAAQAARACQDHALFMRDVEPGLSFLIIFLAIPFAAGLVSALAKDGNPKLADPIETTTLPHDRTETPHTPLTPPPAYAEESESVHPSAYVDVRWGVQRDETRSETQDDATIFVIGSINFSFLVFLLFLIALSIQSLACKEMPEAFLIFLWIIYGSLVVFSLLGLGSWLVLLRNLWGKQGRERFAFHGDFLLNGVVYLLRLPFDLAVNGVRACQKHFCGRNVADDEDVELGITPSSARFPREARDDDDEPATTSVKDEARKDKEEPDEESLETQGLLVGQESASRS